MDFPAQGRIKSFNTEKGFGFIESECFKACGMGDVFVHHSQLQDLQVSDLVAFHVRYNCAGQPQAENVVLIRREDSQGSEREASASRLQGKVHRGMIKSFNAKTGYGFVDSEVLRQCGLKDAFLAASELRNFQVGDPVCFEVQFKGGRPQAVALKDAGAEFTLRVAAMDGSTHSIEKLYVTDSLALLLSRVEKKLLWPLRRVRLAINDRSFQASGGDAMKTLSELGIDEASLVTAIQVRRGRRMEESESSPGVDRGWSRILLEASSEACWYSSDYKDYFDGSKSWQKRRGSYTEDSVTGEIRISWIETMSKDSDRGNIWHKVSGECELCHYEGDLFEEVEDEEFESSSREEQLHWERFRQS